MMISSFISFIVTFQSASRWWNVTLWKHDRYVQRPHFFYFITVHLVRSYITRKQSINIQSTKSALNCFRWMAFATWIQRGSYVKKKKSPYFITVYLVRSYITGKQNINIENTRYALNFVRWMEFTTWILRGPYVK